jgi:cell division protein FtsZ
MLDDLSLKGTKGLLVSLTAGADINPFEIQGALSVIQKDVGEECEVIFGIFQDEQMGDNFKTAVIATGMDQSVEEKIVEINKENNSSESNFVDVINDNEPENIELEVKKTSPEEPHNMDFDDYNDFDDDFSESLSEENISNLPEPEDWEKDDGVPLFNSDRFDSSEEEDELNSQLEIPALQRFFGKIKGQ